MSLGEADDMIQKSVYLAGPITGLSYEDARNGWRAQFADMLADTPHIHCASPMRAKQFLEGRSNLSGAPSAYASNPLATACGITTRDHNDVLNCDAMVANFLGAERASIGTAIEFGWASAYKKPVVMVIEPNGDIVTGDGVGQDSLVHNPHWHMMMNTIAGYIVGDLEEAAYIVRHLLTPGV